jgi:hypothetical protein
MSVKVRPEPKDSGFEAREAAAWACGLEAGVVVVVAVEATEPAGNGARFWAAGSTSVTDGHHPERGAVPAPPFLREYRRSGPPIVTWCAARRGPFAFCTEAYCCCCGAAARLRDAGGGAAG